MTTISKFSLAGLVCILIATGTLAANASHGVAPTAGARSVGTMVALNPQPLPPGYRNDDDDDVFRG
jgi:hypothetical protein